MSRIEPGAGGDMGKHYGRGNGAFEGQRGREELLGLLVLWGLCGGAEKVEQKHDLYSRAMDRILLY